MSEHNVIYRLHLSFDLGAMLPQVGEVLSQINQSMAEFGISEKLCLRTAGLRADIRTPEFLHEPEATQLQERVIAEINRLQPTWAVKLEKSEWELDMP